MNNISEQDRDNLVPSFQTMCGDKEFRGNNDR